MNTIDLSQLKLSKDVEHFINVSTEAIQFPKEFIVCAVLSTTSIAIGNSKRLIAKAGWYSSACLYQTLVGVPSSKKSPAIEKATEPLERIQKRLYNEFKERGILNPKHEGYIPLSQIMTTDTTVEALAVLLQRNPHGLMILKDELKGFFNSLNQYKSGGDDRQQYLQLYNSSIIMVNRKGEEVPLFIEDPYISLLGGLQPELLSDINKSDISDGFIERILFCFPEFNIGEKSSRVELEDVVMDNYCNVIYQIFNKCYEISNSGEIVQCYFTPEAKELFFKWHDELAFQSVELPSKMQAVMGKMQGTTIRLALILSHLQHPEDIDRTEIDIDALKGAIHLAKYYINNFEKVLNASEDVEGEKRQLNLIDWMKRQYKSNKVTPLNGAIGISPSQIVAGRVGGFKNVKEVLDYLEIMQNQKLGKLVRYMAGKTERKIFCLYIDDKYSSTGVRRAKPEDFQ